MYYSKKNTVTDTEQMCIVWQNPSKCIGKCSSVYDYIVTRWFIDRPCSQAVLLVILPPRLFLSLKILFLIAYVESKNKSQIRKLHFAVSTAFEISS